MKPVSVPKCFILNSPTNFGAKVTVHCPLYNSPRQYSAVYSTVQDSTVQCTVQSTTVQCSFQCSVLCSVLCSEVQCGRVQYRAVEHSIKKRVPYPGHDTCFSCGLALYLLSQTFPGSPEISSTGRPVGVNIQHILGQCQGKGLNNSGKSEVGFLEKFSHGRSFGFSDLPSRSIEASLRIFFSQTNRLRPRVCLWKIPWEASSLGLGLGLV